MADEIAERLAMETLRDGNDYVAARSRLHAEYGRHAQFVKLGEAREEIVCRNVMFKNAPGGYTFTDRTIFAHDEPQSIEWSDRGDYADWSQQHFAAAAEAPVPTQVNQGLIDSWRKTMEPIYLSIFNEGNIADTSLIEPEPDILAVTRDIARET